MVVVLDGWMDGWGGHFLFSFGVFWSSSGLTFALSLHHMFSTPPPPCLDPPDGVMKPLQVSLLSPSHLPFYCPATVGQMSLWKRGGGANVSCSFSEFS